MRSLKRNVRILAHRGASAYAPENTMEAFRLGVEQQADGFEIDIHVTKDGEIVVIHDDTIDRTSDGSGSVSDMTLAELKRFNYNARFEEAYEHAEIPTLRQVLELVRDRDLYLNIEVKDILSKSGAYESLAAASAALVKEYGLEEQVIFSSFNHGSMVNLKRMFPELKTGLLHFAGLYRGEVYAKSAGADALHPLYIGVNREMVEQAREAGVAVNCWTVNAPAEMDRMFDAGVDAIITDRPDLCLERRGAQR